MEGIYKTDKEGADAYGMAPFLMVGYHRSEDEKKDTEKWRKDE